MKRKRIIVFLAFGHGLNDLIAGYFLGRLVQLNTDVLQVSIGLFLYNLIAFGGQYPVALLLEKTRKPKQLLSLACGLNVLAVCFFIISPQLSIIMAGIASAIYHVAGGSVCAEKNRATDIGLFAAPGVAGLIAGGYFAYEGLNILMPLFIIAIIFFSCIFFLRLKNSFVTKELHTAKPAVFSIDKHDLIMILLLTVISLRSVIWNIFQVIHEKNYHWLLAIAAAAFVGKIIGGWLADKIGWRLYAMASLLLATPLLSFFRNELLLFCIGVGLLQSGIPATTSLLIQSMKGKTERAISLSFGTAIIVGAIVFYSPLQTVIFSQGGLWIIAVLMFVLLIWGSSIRNIFSSRAEL